MIQERVKAGLERARKAGKVLGRPRIEVDQEQVEQTIAQGHSVRKTAAILGISPSKVQRLQRERQQLVEQTERGSRVATPLVTAEVVAAG
jgi:DNA invertase Pin-like site-specific DNA recombinase